MWGFVVVNGIRGEERKKKGRLKNIHGRTLCNNNSNSNNKSRNNPIWLVGDGYSVVEAYKGGLFHSSIEHITIPWLIRETIMQEEMEKQVQWDESALKSFMYFM